MYKVIFEENCWTSVGCQLLLGDVGAGVGVIDFKRCLRKAVAAFA